MAECEGAVSGTGPDGDGGVTGVAGLVTKEAAVGAASADGVALAGVATTIRLRMTAADEAANMVTCFFMTRSSPGHQRAAHLVVSQRLAPLHGAVKVSAQVPPPTTLLRLPTRDSRLPVDHVDRQIGTPAAHGRCPTSAPDVAGRSVARDRQVRRAGLRLGDLPRAQDTRPAEPRWASFVARPSAGRSLRGPGRAPFGGASSATSWRVSRSGSVSRSRRRRSRSR